MGRRPDFRPLKAFERFEVSLEFPTLQPFQRFGMLTSRRSLHNLRTLEIQALTSFSVNEILGYISTLQPTNQGLNLLVLNQNAEYDISEKEQSVIQKSIAEKVDGRFEFVLFREVEDSEIDSDSD